jgi:hypothetical protein
MQLRPFKPFRNQWPAVFGNQGIRQPIVLTKADGTVFVNSDGNVLTRRFRRMSTNMFDYAALDLNFARTKTLDPRITFTRASSGTYFDANGVMQTAGNNVARFDHDPATGESLGLLVEESRTNLLQRSQEFDNAFWAKIKGGTGLDPVVTANAATAPDGTQTADQFVFDQGAGTALADFSGLQSTGLVGANTYALSVWMRVPTGTAQIALRLAAPGGIFTVCNVTTEWQRFVLVSTSADDSSTPFQLIIRGTWGTSQSVTAYFWGAQLEVGSFPTSHVKTEAAQVTRAADNAEMTGTNFSGWYNAAAGTLYADANTRKLGDIVTLGDVDITADELGAKKYTETYDSDPSATELEIDGSGWTGRIKRLSYWNQALNAEQLEALTK